MAEPQSQPQPQPHILMLPHIEHGHITPMLSLASQLVALGCRVTFVKGERSSAEKQIMGSGGPEERLLFVTVEGEVARGQGVQWFERELKGLEETRKPLVARLVQESLASAHPISCFISDFFMWKWMSPLALSLGLPLALLAVSSATVFHVHCLHHKGNYSEVEDLLVSAFGLPTTNFLDTGIKSSQDSPEYKKQRDTLFHSLHEGFEVAGHSIFVNSFKHLEAPLLPFLEASPLEFKFIGPCFPTWSRDQVGMMAQRAGSVFSEEQACMPWLDKQEKGSVLFVSFGSQASTRAAEQMEELAMGIEKSGYKFLWVVRADAPVGPPEVFRERINRGGGERGVFASWVPQSKVLQHPAVGGFLTHSGWNSTVESVTFGVPMLCLPFFGDQPLHANIVQWYWKVGVRLGRSECESESGNYLVGREEVERGVRTIMQGHTSRSVAHYQQAAQSAIADAHETLLSFVQSLAGESK